MRLIINGQDQDIPDHTATLQHLIEYLNLNPTRVVTEINRHLVPKKNYPSYTLQEGDTLEIITFVGGG